MSYKPDHEPCSDCRDVKESLDPASKDVLAKECILACESSGGSAMPVFFFGNNSLRENCREYQTRLQCWIRITFEEFKCNCKPCPASASLPRKGLSGGGGGGCCP